MVLPECGHVPHEEKPEEFLRAVLGQIGQEAEAGGEGGDETAVAGASTEPAR